MMLSLRHFTDQLIGHMRYLTPPPDRSGRLNPPNCPSILLLLLLCVVNANLQLFCMLNAPLLFAAYKSPRPLKICFFASLQPHVKLNKDTAFNPELSDWTISSFSFFNLVFISACLVYSLQLQNGKIPQQGWSHGLHSSLSHVSWFSTWGLAESTERRCLSTARALCSRTSV